jgi:hypothetical protein
MAEELHNSTTPPLENEGQSGKKERKKRSGIGRFLLFVFKTVGYVLMFTIILALILQIPFVQNYTIQKTTEYLTKELKTTVKIDQFTLNFLDEITIKGLFVANQNTTQDTLLSVGSLRVDISYPYLLFGIVQLDAIKLEDVKARLKRDSGQYDFNHQFIINYFDPPKDGSPTPSKPLDLHIGEVHLRDIDFVKNDRVGGQIMTVQLKAADIHTNIMNLPKGILDIAQLKIHDPYFHVDDIVKMPLPPKPKKEYVDTTPQYLAEKKVEKTPFRFQIGAVSINNGAFELDNWRKAPKRVNPPELMEFQHLDVYDINLFVHNLIYFKEDWTGVIDGISLKEKSGFQLNKLIVGDAKISPKETALYGLQIETPNTLVGDTLRFLYPEGYESFNNFEEKVVIDAKIHSGKVMLEDIMTFAVGLEKNKFFVQNRKEYATINASVWGKINSLKLPDFDIKLGKGFRAAGVFESKDLSNSSETFINLDLKELQTTMPSLRSLIPNFRPSEQFDRFGKLDFKGKFLGFFNNFTANGTLKTDIGGAKMDVKFEPESDRNSAPIYSGNLDLDRFNLGLFTQNPDLGRITLNTKIIKGSGFNKDNVNLNLDATVDSFEFKNYAYRNINLAGIFNRNLFNGKLESKDPNANFVFDGTLDVTTAVPIYKFTSKINKIQLKTLNLIKDNLAVSGDVNLDITGSKISDITGVIDLKNVILTKNDTQQFIIDTIEVISVRDPDNKKHLDVKSEVLTASLDGVFEVEQIHEAILHHFAKNHPNLATDLNILPKKPLTFLPNFSFNVNIVNTKNLTQLFAPKLYPVKNFSLVGSLDDAQNEMKWEVENYETNQYDNIKIVEFATIGHSKDRDIDWDLKMYNVSVGDKQDFKDLIFQNHITGDTIEFGFTSHSFSKALSMDTVELNALLMRQDSFYKLSFGTNQLSKIKIFGQYWNVDSDNFILFRKGYLDIKGFDLRHDDLQITLESCHEAKGLSATLNNFDISILNPYIKDSRFPLAGKYLLNVEFDDIFNQKDFRIHASMDSFIVKGENRGALRISAMGPSLEKPIYTDIVLLKGEHRLTIDGYYYPKAYNYNNLNDDALNINLGLQKFPFRTLQLLIESGATNFVGNVDANMSIKGALKKLDFNGALRLKEAAVTVDYIQSRLYIKDETVRITNTRFDMDGCSIYDSLGHKARVSGGLTHNRFRSFGINARIQADTFLVLNTKRSDNSLYYGTGIGRGDIEFTGDFDRTNIRVRATAGKGTKIVFPFSSEQTASDKNFVLFRAVKNTEGVKIDTSKKVKELKGVNFDMDLTMTNQAEFTLIFDEVAGDNIRAKGTGNIFLSVNRAGNMTMTGEYRIEQGDYLFTLLKLVNKNFALERGGTIRWSGDPFNAQINIDARYKDLSTSPYNFIAEYVINDKNADQESRKPTPVELSLKLSGALLKPDVNFNLAFPRLSNNLKTYADNKLRLLQQDQNELNRQVFGLIVVNSFLPSDVAFATNSQILSGGINTIAQTVSSVVSNIFNKFINEYVEGVDVQIGYSIFEYDRSGIGDIRSSGQQFRLRGSYDINDKWTVSGGVGVESGGYLQALNGSNVFVGGDFILDHSFTEDRRLKLRFSYTRDQVFEGRRDKTAVGIRFRQEFDTLDELLESLKLKKAEKKAIELNE